MSTFNRLYNVRNPFQTDARKVLCVCSAGLLRSPTMANVLHQEYGYNTRAAGCTWEYALIAADEVLVQWADEIVCAEDGVRNELAHKVDLTGKKVIVLHVRDTYEWNDPELRGLILKQYKDASIMEMART